jgi:spermidine synthase
MSRVRARVEAMYRDLRRRERAADADNEIEVVLLPLTDENGDWLDPLPDPRVRVVFADGTEWIEGGS